MRRRIKTLIAAAVLAIPIATSTAALAYSVNEISSNVLEYVYATGAAVSINNLVTGIDYKLNDGMLEKMHKDALGIGLAGADKDETELLKQIPVRSLYGTTDAVGDLSGEKSDVDDTTVAKNWLIENNIVQRKIRLEYNDDSTPKVKAIPYVSEASEFKQEITSLLGTEDEWDANNYNTNKQAESVYEKLEESAIQRVKLSYEQNLITTKKYKSAINTIENTTDAFEKAAAKQTITYSKLKGYTTKLLNVVAPVESRLMINDSDAMLKSDFLVALYKSCYGPIQSRGIVYKSTPIRDGNFQDEVTSEFWKGNRVSKLAGYFTESADDHVTIEVKTTPEGFIYSVPINVIHSNINSAKFTGDYWMYYSADVYELYLKSMLDKGLVYTSDLDTETESANDNTLTKKAGDSPGKRFKKDYENFSEANAPAWWSGLSANTAGQSEYALGYCTRVTKDSIEQRDPNYFKQEGVSVLTALQYVEDFMRLSEDDMTELEADIVNYKYGVTYLDSLSSKERKTVSFLIAKGIVDYSSPEELRNLYGELTREMAYKLLYRVANKDARANFSAVQLTDSENFWARRGYGSETIDYVSIDEAPVNVSVSTEVATNQNSNPILNWYNSIVGASVVNAATGSTDQTYTVVKRFSKSSDYEYCGIPLSELSLDVSKAPGVVSVTDVTVKINKKSTKCYEVTFKLLASSKVNALSYIDSHTKVTAGKRNSSIELVTKITNESNQEYSMISKSTVLKCFPQIAILEDKVLQNKETGAQAVIFTTENYALVGNQVIRGDDVFVTDVNKEVYYDLKVILSLLKNSYLARVGEKTLYSCDSIKESSVKVTTQAVAGYNNKAYVTVQDAVAQATNKNNEGDIGSAYSTGDKVPYYKVDSFSSGISSVYRVFEDAIGQPVVVMMDLTYVVPSCEDFNAYNWYLDTQRTNTISEATKVLYTRPEKESLLQTWWDSNYGMSNALANFIFGTSRLEYVRSGYLVPDLIVLAPDTYTEDELNDLFVNNGFELVSYGGVSYDKFVNGTTYKFWKSYYSGYGLEEQPLKALATQYKEFTRIAPESVAYGFNYNNQFILTNGGVLYRNAEQDSRISVKLSSNRDSVKSLQIKNRSASYEDVPDGTVIQWNGKKWVLAQQDSQYWYLVPMFAEGVTEGSLTTSRDGLVFRPNNSNWKDSIVELFNQNFPEVAGSYTPDTGISAFYCNDRLANQLNVRNAYYSKGTLRAYKNGKWELVNEGDARYEQYFSSYDNTVDSYSLPLMKVPVSTYHVYKDSSNVYRLGKGFLPAALNFNYFFYSGIAEGVIDAVIANHFNVVKLNTLEDEQRLVIDDIEWTRSGDYFVSEPIKNKKIVAAAKKLKSNQDNFKAQVLKLWTSKLVQCDGKSYAFTGYVDEIDLGVWNNKTKMDGRTISYDAFGSIVVTEKDGITVTDDLSKSVKYAVVKIKLNDELLARPLNPEGTKFVLLTSVSSGVFDTPNDFPFFGESLSFGVDKNIKVEVSNNKFKPSGAFNSAKGRFAELYRGILLGDIVSMVKIMFICVAGYLAVISFVVYLLLTLGNGTRILEAVAMPRGDGSMRGFDVVKLVSFGIYGINDRPSISRILVFMFGCILLSTIILYL